MPKKKNAAEKQETAIIGITAEMHCGAGEEYPVLSVLNPGTSVVTVKKSGAWICIYFGEISGWIPADAVMDGAL